MSSRRLRRNYHVKDKAGRVLRYNYFCHYRHSRGFIPAQHAGAGGEDAKCDYRACVCVNRTGGETAGNGVVPELFEVFTRGGHTCGWTAHTDGRTASSGVEGSRGQEGELEIIKVEDDP